MNTISHELLEKSRLAVMDDLIRFWRSKVKGQVHTLVQVRGGEDIHVDAGTSKSVF